MGVVEADGHYARDEILQTQVINENISSSSDDDPQQQSGSGEIEVQASESGPIESGSIFEQ